MRRSLALVAIAPLAALTLAACGDDDDSGDAATTDVDRTSAPADTSAPTNTGERQGDGGKGGDGDVESGSEVPPEVREMFPEMTDEQLTCLQETGEDLRVDDLGVLTKLLEECGVELGDLVPADLTIPDDLQDLDVQEMLEDITPEQLECIGTRGQTLDPTDPAQAADLFEDCGVDIGDLVGGG